jgi:hypothetical protein
MSICVGVPSAYVSARKLYRVQPTLLLNKLYITHTKKNPPLSTRPEAPAAIHHNGSNELDLRPCRETSAHRPPTDKDRFMPRRPEQPGDNDAQ